MQQIAFGDLARSENDETTLILLESHRTTLGILEHEIRVRKEA
jgi:hypothetical protein